MAVQFVLGRSGSGKSRRSVERIAEMLKDAPLGPAIFLLVPRQATFQAERELTGITGGFMRVHVVSFDELAREILNDCGDVGIPQVSATGRRLVIGHLLRKHAAELNFYGQSARRPGLAAELDATFGEFERAGLEAAEVDELARGTASAEPLAGKLHDVALLLKAYNNFIGQEWLDPARRMERVIQRVENCRLFRGATVFVDEFFEFGANELKLLVGIARTCPRTEISLLVDPDSPVIGSDHRLPEDLSLFHRTERTYRALVLALKSAEVEIDPPVLLRESKRFGSAPLSKLEASLFTSTAKPFAGGAAVEMFAASDMRSEVDAVARRIRGAFSTQVRLRDIAVLVRDMQAYHEIIQASFAEHGVHFFADRRRAAVHHPLLQFVRSAILIGMNGWPHEAVMVMIKTGLAGMSQPEVDGLENYVTAHPMRGQMWESQKPWKSRRKATLSQDSEVDAEALQLEQLDAARKSLAEKLQPLNTMMRLDQPISLKDFAVQIVDLLQRFEVRKTIVQWITEAEASGELEQAGEHQQVWTNLMELLDHMVNLLGKESISAADFLDAFETGIESFDLALPPQTIDGVLVGQVDRTRLPAVKWVFVLGLNEGMFPRVAREDCVLSDSERRSLQSRKVNLDPEVQRRLLDERLLAYVAFTGPAEKLILSRAIVDHKNRAVTASVFWEELRRLCPDVVVQQARRADASGANGIGTPRQLMTGLMRWARAGAAIDDENGSWAALYQWLATRGIEDDAVDRMRRLAWGALGYSNEATLSAEVAKRLFPLEKPLPVSQLESFASCPFQHFARYGLKLLEPQSAEVTAVDLSRAHHSVLEKLLAELIGEGVDWRALSGAELQARIHRLAEVVGRQVRDELLLSNARNRHILKRIEEMLMLAVETQREMQGRGGFRPAGLAVRFDEGQRLGAYEIVTPMGYRLKLRGTIDRINIDDNAGLFALLDYKLKAGGLQLDRMLHGINLQLLTGLLVMQSGAEKLAGKPVTAAAALLVPLLRSLQKVDHPDRAMSPEHPDFHLRDKPRGIVRLPAVHAVDKNLETGLSSVVQVRINKDGSLGHQNQSDAMGDEDLAAILQWLPRKIGELADQMQRGVVAVAPYWIAEQTPCSRCGYRSICRFEVPTNNYRFLKAMPRTEVIDKMKGKQ